MTGISLSGDFSLRTMRQPFLANLAVAARCLAEPARRHAGRATEAAHEVGDVVETGVVSDVDDRPSVLEKQPRGAPQACAPGTERRRGGAEGVRTSSNRGTRCK